MRRNRIVYTLLSIGVLGAFLGHGAFAIDGKESFIEMFTGSFDNVLGVTVSNDTATNWVLGIGLFDVAISIVVLVMLVGNVLAKGSLDKFAYSRIALAVYGWAALWGFVTAAARMTGAGQFTPEVWDLVERAPNFMLPAALVYIVHQHRLDHRATSTTPAGVKRSHRAATQ